MVLDQVRQRAVRHDAGSRWCRLAAVEQFAGFREQVYQRQQSVVSTSNPKTHAE